MDRVDELARAFERFPGIGPRQAKRFVYHLLASNSGDRNRLADLISSIGASVKQCSECRRFWSGIGDMCQYCSDRTRNDAQLMLVERDQDLLAMERTGSYRGRYFVLGGVLTLSGKGAIRERELVERVERRSNEGLEEIILALSATSVASCSRYAATCASLSSVAASPQAQSSNTLIKRLCLRRLLTARKRSLHLYPDMV
jgi:recombination protein RecR